RRRPARRHRHRGLLLGPERPGAFEGRHVRLRHRVPEPDRREEYPLVLHRAPSPAARQGAPRTLGLGARHALPGRPGKHRALADVIPAGPEGGVVFLSGTRTGFGAFGGALKDLSATDLGVVAARSALDRSGIEPAAVGHVIFGNVLQTSADAPYLARHVGLR